jgi:hypothetical protein
MAITRIKNNQITDASIIASAKLHDHTITAGKLANNITYGSNFTISGNLTVNGTTTTVDTNNMTVDDPLLLLASNQTGSGAVDIGFIGERGDDTNVAFVFDESADEFAVALTSTADANTTITITDYADLHAGGITADDTITATGNVSGGNVTSAGTVQGGEVVSDALTSGRVVLAGTDGVLEDSTNLTFNGSTLAATGAITASTTITATGNVVGGNLTTAGAMDSATLSTTGNASIGENLTITGDLTVNGTTTTVNSTVTTVADPIMTFGQNASDDNKDRGIEFKYNDGSARVGFFGFDDSTGKFTFLTAATNSSEVFSGTAGGASFGTVDASANITGGNLITSALTSTATLTTSGEATLASAIVSDLTDNRVVIAGSSGALEDDANFTFNGSTLGLTGTAAITGNAGISTSAIVGDVIGNITSDVVFEVASTSSMKVPVGNTAQRPGTGVTGMLRFNSQLDQLEFYDVDSWQSAGADFTVIASQTFDGDGSTVAFTLSENQTTASCIVSINGVVQLPTTAYGVSGTTLTFTEAPISGDKIEVRKVTTTTTVTALVSADSSAQVNVADGADVSITGNATFSTNIFASGNAVANIGSSSNQFNTVHAKATSAEYADLAEMYAADEDIAPGTVVVFGGTEEVTASTQANDHRVAGVISTNPSYLMNSQIDADHAVAVALTGRVPCKVSGTVSKGDLMVSGPNGTAQTNNSASAGTIIGKALEDSVGDAVIEVVVGRF